MKLFHVTTARAAAAILGEGFRDGNGYGTAESFSGVWLADRPLDVNEGAQGDTVLAVRFAVPLSALADYEWIEQGKPYREWLVPANFIARHATVALFGGDDAEDERRVEQLQRQAEERHQEKFGPYDDGEQQFAEWEHSEG